MTVDISQIKPGDELILNPVKVLQVSPNERHSNPIQVELWDTDNHARLLWVSTAAVASLIPAVRITELEAEVARLRAVYDIADTLLDALRANGYPVSEAAWENTGEIMSREARNLHLTALNLRAAIEMEGREE